MPAPLASKEEILERLAATFRRDGYDGASLAVLSKRTGLGKSSLYHHFPGGKEQMALEVLAHLGASLRPVLAAAAGERPPAQRLTALLAAVDDFYGSGRLACLLERLCASADRSRFARPVRAVFEALIEAFARIGRDAGIPRATARARAEAAVVRIEGSLVVAVGLGDVGVFGRALAEIRETLLQRDG